VRRIVVLCEDALAVRVEDKEGGDGVEREIGLDGPVVSYHRSPVAA
jgi:hypothetical protein